MEQTQYPDLLKYFLSLFKEENLCNKATISRKVRTDFVSQKRSKSHIQLQREINKIQMIEAFHNMITLEDSQEEYHLQFDNYVNTQTKGLNDKVKVKQDTTTQKTNEMPAISEVLDSI